MKKSQLKLPSFQMKRRLFSKRKPSAHAKKWLNSYFKEEANLTASNSFKATKINY